jgi:hypothetical protein
VFNQPPSPLSRAPLANTAFIVSGLTVCKAKVAEFCKTPSPATPFLAALTPQPLNLSVLTRVPWDCGSMLVALTVKWAKHG